MPPKKPTTQRRCAWADGDDLLRAYHDREWGVPERDGRALWEALVLDGFQAGLAWITILRKREAFRQAFKSFDPKVVARFGADDIARLMADKGIVRSQAKIVAAIGSAKAYLAMQERGEDFSTFVWSFVGGTPIDGGRAIVASSPVSVELSKAFKARGFKFVGPVITYAWMQAVGLVNDHEPDCFRRAPSRRPRR